MLPKNKRVPRELFKALLESKQYFNSTHFSLRIAPYSTPKFSVSVSKKVSKKAVVRNRIRRRVYSALRSFFGEAKPGLYLLVAKTGSDRAKGEELKRELAELIKKS